jgi:conserved hypothetical nucleotide-binding protein
VAIILNTRLNSENETISFSKRLAKCSKPIQDSIVIHLKGDLGAGKTTLARGFIQYFGFEKVKSPTYSLVESYQNESINIHHFDCYRLSDPEELDYIGIRDYLNAGHIQLIEWAEIGKGFIAKADLTIGLEGFDEQRNLSIVAHTQIGEQLLQCVSS